jgi:hypothetical protein
MVDFLVGDRSEAVNMQFITALSMFEIFNRMESKLDFKLYRSSKYGSFIAPVSILKKWISAFFISGVCKTFYSPTL